MESSRTGIDTEITAGEGRPEREPSPEKEPSRFDMLMRNRRRLLLVLLLLLIAVAVVVGSTAVFTSESVNPGNLATSGKFTLTDDQNGAIFKAERMFPGGTQNGEVTLENTGDVKGTFTLAASDLKDPTMGSKQEKLSSVLTLKIEQVNPTIGNPIVYNGAFDKVPTLPNMSNPIPLGDWDPKVPHKYRFTVTMKDVGNEYQGLRTEVTFKWDGTAS